MTNHHAPHTVERHCDVAVVGGSAAGLAAALQISRQRWSVIVIDAGEPRNAPAAHMHGYLGHEGAPPPVLTSIGREEVRSYGGEVVQGRVTTVTRRDDGRFHLQLVGGNAVVARRVVAATGLIDILPEVEGLAQHWGRDVIHCPFCHGYEVRDQRVVQILTHPMGLHPAGLFRHLTDRLTIVVHDSEGVDAAGLAALEAGGVQVVDARAQRVLTDADGRVSGLELADGRVLDADAIAVTTRFDVRAQPFEPLGLALTEHPSGLGSVVEAGPDGRTSVPGLFAAGNVTDPSQQVLIAAANGSWTGAMVCADLAHEDLTAAARPSANEADWDNRYGDRPMWSGNPNGALVVEAEALTVGRALDVGAGEGGDAIWLAEQGWSVTASDISSVALARIDAEAQRRGLAVDCRTANANARAPYGDDTFDLVSAQYASIPRTPDGRGVANLLAAVAPGGSLVVVSHDLEPMRTPVDTTTHSRPFDADAYVRVEDFVAALESDPAWTIEVHEKRPRPAGAASTHHVDDVVLRARRA